MVDRKKLGKNNRRKGHDLERQVANKLKSIYPHAKRALEYQKGLTYDLTNTGSLFIQCKRSNKSVSLKHLEDVECHEDGIAVLASKTDRQKIKVTLYLDDLIKLLNDIGEAYKPLNFETSEGLRVAQEEYAKRQK